MTLGRKLRSWKRHEVCGGAGDNHFFFPLQGTVEQSEVFQPRHVGGNGWVTRPLVLLVRPFFVFHFMRRRSDGC